MLKTCNKCGAKKIVSDFPRFNNKAKQPCKTCKSAYNRNRLSTPEGREDNKVRCIAHYQTNKESRKASVHRYRTFVRYGISEVDYVFLLDLQNGCCALCGDPEFRKRKLSVDHWHGHHLESPEKACKKCVRGLLCDACNRHFLPVVERYSHLQTETVRLYLSRRPFCNASDAFAKASLSEMCK